MPVFKNLVARWFGPRSQSAPDRQIAAISDPSAEAFLKAIRDRSKTDPQIGPNIGAAEIFQRSLKALKDGHGMQIESLLCLLGAVAGYSCQASLRAEALARGMSETAFLNRYEAKDGRRYYFGNELNKRLGESNYSVLGLAIASASHLGCAQTPNLEEIHRHSNQAIGTDGFGFPRLPDRHKARETPYQYLVSTFPLLLPTAKLFCPDPKQWPVLFGLAIQKAMVAAKDSLPPEMALRIVMESAVPMSKVELPS